MTNPTSASAVSRALRAGGLRPIPSGSTREGLVVTGRSSVYIRLGFDLDSTAARVRADVEEILAESGYSVDVVSDRVLHVSRKGI
jgi:hypothetical protein